MATNGEVVAIENAVRKAGSVLLLDHVSLIISSGERWTIQGPTGAGKTVLLRAIAALDPLDAGEVRFEGRRMLPEQMPAYRRRVIYLQQRPVLLEGTVESNLREPYRYESAAGTEFSRDEVAGWLSVFGRDESFLNRASGDLSGGESQIVALIRAIQLAPEVLLLDEPTTALDRDIADIFEALVLRWWEEDQASRAFVWISHDAALRARVATHVAEIKRGKLELV